MKKFIKMLGLTAVFFFSAQLGYSSCSWDCMLRADGCVECACATIGNTYDLCGPCGKVEIDCCSGPNQ